MKKIDEKLEKVYNFTVEYSDQYGFPPSIREICEKCGIKSTASAYSYVEKLKKSGLINKSPLKKRAISVSNRTEFRSIPIVGCVRAGEPIFAVENLDGYIPLPSDIDVSGQAFALKVDGNSMINAGINDRDVIIVRKQENANNGDIVVALVDDSATVKRFFKTNDKIILHPENDEMSDLVFDDVKILGIVKGLIRKF